MTIAVDWKLSIKPNQNCLLAAIFSSADCLCKQFGPISDIGPDLTLIVIQKEFFKKANFEKSQHTAKKIRKITQHAKSFKKYHTNIVFLFVFRILSRKKVVTTSF